MQAYTRFAEVYDTFMDNVPYEEWATYLVELLKEYGVEDGVVVELGCGTGSMTRLLAQNGYNMIGIDNSYEMLEIARDREYADFDYEEDDYECHNDSELESNELDDSKNHDEEDENEYEYEDSFENSILYLEQDMREIELYGTAKAIVSVCDSMNYITTEVDLKKVFTLVNNYLDKDGVFIFDMNTEYKYSEILGDNTIAENREDCSFIWENYYDVESMMNEYHVTIYVNASDDNEDVKTSEVKLFERFEETHYQKAYKINTVIQLIEEAGMEFVAVYDAFTKEIVTDTSQRVYFIAKEKEQMGKIYK